MKRDNHFKKNCILLGMRHRPLIILFRGAVVQRSSAKGAVASYRPKQAQRLVWYSAWI